jgi:hypothetical protein
VVVVKRPRVHARRVRVQQRAADLLVVAIPAVRRCIVVLRASVTGPRCQWEGGRERTPGSP